MSGDRGVCLVGGKPFDNLFPLAIFCFIKFFPAVSWTMPIQLVGAIDLSRSAEIVDDLCDSKYLKYLRVQR